jgi:cephalosporin hydroxylase
VDDREQFKHRAQMLSIEMGRDQPLFEQSIGTILAADRYEYSYLWSWMGVPIIQLPADVMATQEVIFATKPDVIVETGVARGGSVIFMASLLELIGKGKIIGVDIDIRPHNRDSIESHPMAKRICLVEGASNDETTLDRVRAEIPRNSSVMVVLDSDHSRDHVLAELRAYGSLVTPGQYLVVADTLVGYLDEEQAPKNRSKCWHKGNEPLTALNIFLGETSRFQIDPIINGKLILSSSPGGYLKCV